MIKVEGISNDEFILVSCSYFGGYFIGRVVNIFIVGLLKVGIGRVGVGCWVINGNGIIDVG